jgi:CheY-like chemotaxis protein
LEQVGVLVVEENDGVRTLLETALKEYGLKVWQAASGPQALELYQRDQHAISVVLLDVGMEAWDGPQTLTALRAIRPDLLCCFMTGGGSKYSEADLLGMGTGRVFTKPFSLEEVSHALQSLAVTGERRTFPRLTDRQFKVCLAEIESGMPPQDGWLCNRSEGGIGIRLSAAVAVGAVLSVRPAASPEDMPWQRVAVKYCLAQEQGWSIGGQFLSFPSSSMMLLTP